MGFELEFSGVDLDSAAHAIQDTLGGEVVQVSAAQREVHVPGAGDFRVELDWDFLLRTAGKKKDEDWVELLSKTAAILVPTEIVCPPLAMSRLDELLELEDGLRAAGAVGTEESLLAAYGVHINTELPRLNAATLDAYLRAFSLLQWWLLEAHQVNPARRVSPYIDLYPELYVRQLIERDGANMDEIFSDYLQHNATRNRALDMLPVLSEIDAERVLRAVEDPKIKARPAFHYRLPNCQIEKRDWSLAGEWNLWCVVEELAHRPEDLRDLGERFMAASGGLLGLNRSEWLNTVDTWLKDRALV
ncbi:amidoligase family protein [Microbulbifer guangxiensis]|uniref:amidoligase family protein n=1 Tax=Microbulbifer guangxiensis TaxID=2904249 RepID=UPI001F33FCDB